MNLEGLDFNVDPDQPSVVKTLDRIRAGSQMTLLRIHSTMAELNKALNEGDFVQAFTLVQHLGGFLSPLAQAHRLLGYIGNGHLVDVADVEIGMSIVGIGRITNIDDKHCADAGCSELHRTIEVEGHDGAITLLGSMTIVIESGDSGEQSS